MTDDEPRKRPFLDKLNPPKFTPPKRDTSWWLTASCEGFTAHARREIHPDDRIFTLKRLISD